MSRVEIEDETGCWLWTGGLSDKGYAVVRWGGVAYKVHKLFYELTYGKMEAGLESDHTCRVRRCVNPDHIEPVPHIVNVQRGDRCKLK